MNKTILIGNLTKDPEHGTTPSGTAYCRFTLAVNRRFTDANGNKQTDFINIVAWRQLADACARYLAKGRKASVVGQIQSRSYDDRDGSKRYVTEILAEEVEFLSNGVQQSAPPPEEPPEPTGRQQNFTEVDDDERPF